jgi:glycosyltransferase involved in cell wall biosynthesis
MTLPKLVNLLDDFALGGVSRGLGIFDSAPVRAVVDPSVVAIDANAMIAPKVEADVVVTHFPPNWRRLVFLASLRRRNPRAIIIHVEHSYTRAWEGYKVPHRRRFRTMLGFACKFVDKIVCVSSAQADWFAEASRQARDTIEVIYPYANNLGLKDLALSDFATASPLQVGAYGRFDEAKGFDLLIAAYKAGSMPGTELVIGGYGADEDRLKHQAGDTPGIRFVGRIDNVAAFLAGCDVIAIPSRREAFGQVATEAREAGRPIFVSPVDGLPEQVGAAGKIVDFTSVEKVKEAFSRMCPTELTVMSQQARLSAQNAGATRTQDWSRLLSKLLTPQSEMALPNRQSAVAPARI